MIFDFFGLTSPKGGQSPKAQGQVIDQLQDGVGGEECGAVVVGGGEEESVVIGAAVPGSEGEERGGGEGGGE